MTEQVKTFDAWDEAYNPPEREFEIYGQVKIDIYNLFFPGNKQQPVPFDPNVHPENKRSTQVEIIIIPIPEQNISYDVSQKYLTFLKDWKDITLKSIKEIGVPDLRDFRDRWVKLARVPGHTPRKDKYTGELTGEMWTAFKFLELYPDEKACREAYAGSPNTVEDPRDTEEEEALNSNEKKTTLEFAKVILAQVAKTAIDRNDFVSKISVSLANNPQIAKFFSVTSPEIVELIETHFPA